MSELSIAIETNQPIESETSWLSWIVCLSAALFFFYEFIQMNMFNAISADLLRAFNIDGTQLGDLSATYLLGDVIFLLPAGMLLDRFSVRKVIITAMLLCISGTIIFALSTSFYLAAFAHFLAGIGNAFSFLSCIMLASRWFPPKRMALVTGIIVTFAMAGGVVAQTPLTLLAQSLGWRHAVLLNAILGAIILTIIFFVVRDYPSDLKHLQNKKDKALQEMGFMHSLKLALLKPQNWLCGIYTSLLNLPIMLLGALWGSLRLMQIHHLTAKDASLVTSMIFIGTIVGAPIVGWISDKLGRRKMPMIIGALLSLATIFAIIVFPNLNLDGLFILYFLLGFITSAQIISYPTIAESNTRIITGTATGLASVLIMGGGAIAQPFFGWLLDLGWHKHFINGVPIYSHEEFLRAILMIPIAFIIALIAAFFVKETYCKNPQD